MTDYTFIQLESYALLVFLFLLFIYQFRRLWRAYRNRSLLHRNRSLKKIKALSWDDFERLCMEFFSKKGWSVEGNKTKGADGGVDIWMQKRSFMHKNISAIVQCKRYEDSMVTIKVVREMYGLMHEYDVDGVYIVTSSRFTKECYNFVEGKKIVLIDGEMLVSAIGKMI